MRQNFVSIEEGCEWREFEGMTLRVIIKPKKDGRMEKML
jgi:hypothetical protein